MTVKDKKNQREKFEAGLERKIDKQSERYGLYCLYRACYRSKMKMAAEDQSCYDYQDFIAALKDKGYLKFVLRGQDGIPIGLILATEDLEKAKAAYLNPNFYRSWLESHHSGKGILYTTFLGIKPDYQSKSNFEKLVGAMVRYCSKNDLHAGLDFSGTVSKLPKAIQRVIDSLYRRGEINRSADYKKLDYQEFGIFELD